VATSVARRPRGDARTLIVTGLYAVGALALAGEGAVHVQQFVVTFHGVRWIGPLFIANAAACVAAIAGLAWERSRPLAALAGIATSGAAPAGLVLSYGNGLFGWMEAGFRTLIAIAIGTEVGAVIPLATALAAASGAWVVARPRVGAK
jgi:hypothetical protein